MNENGAQRLLEGMLKKRLYVAFTRIVKPELMSRVLERHLKHQIASEKKGVLVVAGPFVSEETGTPVEGGMMILRFNSLDEAKAHVAEDPFVIEGVVEVEVRPWQLNEGRITLSVDFSDGSYNFI